MRGQSAVADEACHRSAATSAGPVRASYGSKSALPAAEIPALVDPTGGHNGPRSGRSASVAGQSDGFRPEIEGLRAVAAFLVAIYHIWIGRVSGGVDVFFVVSGFLITTTLIHQVERGGGVRFTAFWGRLIRRLIPAAYLVLLAVIAGSLLLMPKSHWRDTILDVAASATYLNNWLLTLRSVDYLASFDMPSPTQHYWALSAQAQFYFLWPFLIALCAVVARRSGIKFRRVAAVAVGAILTVSLAYSVYLTHVNQPFAYFHTFARVWEFAIGALLALTARRLRFPVSVRVLLGWVGVLAILACGLLFQVSQVFPGYAALWPTLAAVLVLVSGSTGSSCGVDRVLGSRPLVYLGGISYSLYLWHFPLLIFCRIYTEPRPISFAMGIGVLIGSIVLAVATERWVERPARRSGGEREAAWRPYALGAACALPLVVALGYWKHEYGELKRRTDTDGVAGDPSYPGAAAREPDFVHRGVPGAAVYPGPFAVDRDRRHAGDHQCHPDDTPAELDRCSYGPSDGSVRIAVVGGSHSAHWMPALADLAERNPWQVVPLTRSNCPFQAGAVETGVVGNAEHDTCREWNEAVVSWILRERPSLVFTTATRHTNDGEMVPQSYIDQWARVVAHGIPVVAVRDNPSMGFDVSACVERRGADAEMCSRPRAEALGTPNLRNRIASPPRGVQFIDLSNYFCDRDRCLPVIGNVLIYRHGDHLTSTYSHTLAPMLERELRTAIGRIGSAAPGS
ncbi:MAG: acyltransferase family protein [Steroidobacteraceae bacterium]